MTTSAVPISMAGLDEAYRVLRECLATRIRENTADLFTTSIAPDVLWGRYLECLPSEARAHYNCRSCRAFIERYGGLVTIDEQGEAIPFLWTRLDIPETIYPAVYSLASAVAAARVDGVFRSDALKWGIESNISNKDGTLWTHFYGTPPVFRVSRTPDQQMAELREDFGILNRSIDDYSLAVVAEASRVLESGTLKRSEKADKVAAWFLNLRKRIAASPKRRSNLVWRAVASAPPGFAHVRTTIISTLLDDIASGKGFAEVSRRWSEKMDPTQYQRPQAAPRAGQIDAAERLVAEMGLERSLLRRFATLDDVQVKLWTPRPVEAPAARAGGVFDKLRQDTEKVTPLELPTLKVTWRMFTEKVLPDAQTIEIHAPGRGNYYGLTAAVDPDAPAILQWDGLEGHPRNTVSWYFHHPHSSAPSWGLQTGWNPVSAIFPSPFQWQEPDKFTNHSPSIFFAIVGARESTLGGLALFPEVLQAELRAIRSVIERHSNTTPLVGAEDGNANGLTFSEDSAVDLRVTSAQGVATYRVDRWS